MSIKYILSKLEKKRLLLVFKYTSKSFYIYKREIYNTQGNVESINNVTLNDL